MTPRHIAGFAVGPVLGAVLGLITVPAVAWAFPPSDVGRLNVFNVTLSFLLLFCVLGLDQAFVREYHTSNDKARLLKSCFMPGFLLLAFVAILGSPYAVSLSEILYDTPSVTLYWLTISAAAVGYAVRYLSLILRMQERGLAFSMSQLLPKATLLAFIVGLAALRISRGFIELALGTVLALFCVLLWFGWNTRADWLSTARARIQRDELTALFAYGLPLIVSGIAFWGLTGIATFALKSFSGLSELANYSVATSFANAALIVQSIVSVIWTPLIFKWEATGADLKRVDAAGSYALALVTTAFVAAGSLACLTDLLLPSRYADVKFLVAACAAQPLLYTFSVVTSVGIGIARRTGWTLINTLLAVVANIALTILLVPGHGAKGAAAANAFSFLVLFVANTEVAARVWRPFARAKIYVVTSFTVALSMCIALYGDKSPVHASIVWLMLAPILAYLFRREYRYAAHWIVGMRRRSVSAAESLADEPASGR